MIWCADMSMTQIDSLGYTDVEASNAAEALAVIGSADTVDLLFTDVIMPGSMNGRQLVDEALKAAPLAQDVVHLGI